MNDNDELKDLALQLTRYQRKAAQSEERLASVLSWITDLGKSCGREIKTMGDVQALLEYVEDTFNSSKKGVVEKIDE